MSLVACFRCGKGIPESNLGRQDSCEGCGAATRCCLNCRHHDRSRNNECREEQAPRQVDKEKGNFCEWFQPRTGPGGSGGSTKQDLKNAAEALFRKKA